MAAAAAVVTLVTVALVVGGTREPAALVTADPPAGGRLPAAPTVVTLTFSGPLDPGDTHVVVLGPDGTAVTATGFQVSGDTVTQPVVIPDPGTVTVAYHARFQDGQQLTDVHRFTVGAAGADPGPDPAELPSELVDEVGTDPGGGHVHPLGPVTVGVAVSILLAGLSVLAVALRRGPRVR